MASAPPDWADLRFDPAEISSHAYFCTIHGPTDVWFRQTPGWDGLFGRTAFHDRPTGHVAEWLVVCDEPTPGLRTRIPVDRRILFLGEPPSIKVYPAKYLNQFGVVVGPVSLPGYRGCHIRKNSSLPWHYGRSRPITWRELAADKEKSRVISVFCSDKTFTLQQELRIRFVEKSKACFGPLIEHFGNGYERIEEKADGLAPFRYTIALENNVDDGFWTEKLTDAFLGHCFPIYAGGKVAPDDFDPQARLDIDIADVDGSLRAVEGLIGKAVFDTFAVRLREQRRRVMLVHNLFAVADRIVQDRRERKGRLFWAERIAQSYG